MNYNPTFDLHHESEDQQIKNPAHTAATKQIANIKNQIKKCEQGLGKINITTDESGVLRKNATRDKLQAEMSSLKEKLQIQQTILEALPGSPKFNYANT